MIVERENFVRFRTAMNWRMRWFRAIVNRRIGESSGGRSRGRIRGRLGGNLRFENRSKKVSTISRCENGRENREGD